MKQSDLNDLAYGTGSYARARILRLQSSLLGEGSGSASARATLAQWRKMATGDDYTLLGLGAELLNSWPEDRLGIPRSGSWQLNSLCATLGLYAWHQQSLSYPVCDVSTENHRAITFATACRLIEYDIDNAGSVRRRLSGIESAADFQGVVLNVRALISLMKGARDKSMAKRRISFDYGALARDLCLIQVDWARKRVIDQWGIDYFRTSLPEEDEVLNAES